MPRNRSRFADLERQFRESGGVAAPGSRLAAYIEYKSGKTKATRRKPALTAAQRKRFGVSLVPFNKEQGAAVDQTERYVSSITSYSLNGAKSLGLNTGTDLGYENQVVGGKSAITGGGYYPAILRPFVPAAGVAPTTPLSGITKKEYKYQSGSSYGIPFGKRTANADTDCEEDRRVALSATVRTGGTGGAATSVGYEPEVWRKEQDSLPEAP